MYYRDNVPLAVLCQAKRNLTSSASYRLALNLEKQLTSSKHMVQARHSDLDYLKMSLNLHVLPNFMVSTVPAL